MWDQWPTEICDLKLPWDETVPPLVKQRWKRQKLDISNNQVKIPRSITTRLEPVTVIFGEASVLSYCVAT